jgi:hypothetical protein
MPLVHYLSAPDGINAIPDGYSLDLRAFKHFYKIGLELDWIDPASCPKPPSHFRISIEGHERVLDVAAVVVYAVSKYFHALLASGGVEATTRLITLNDEFPPQLLLSLLKSLHGVYDGHLKQLTRENCEFVLSNGQYMIEPTPLLLPLLDHSHRVAVPHHNLFNFTEVCHLLQQRGWTEEVEKLVQFVLRNLLTIEAMNPNFLSLLPDPVAERIRKEMSKPK